jgi:hypothetical protein
MTDRELLEAAAKASGLLIEYWAQDDYPVVRNGAANVGWNPLVFDSDALRLSVGLGLEVYHSINNDMWTVFVGYPKQQRIVYVMEEWGNDEFAATRRAIVRAAAAMAKP